MSNLNVANTILQQLGGGRFKVMTGANTFVGIGDDQSSPGLMFKVPKGRCNGKSVNKVAIRLSADDTYTMQFAYVRGMTHTVIAEESGVYCDKLQARFTANTGLYTHL